jgi:hypothetical protein
LGAERGLNFLSALDLHISPFLLADIVPFQSACLKHMATDWRIKHISWLGVQKTTTGFLYSEVVPDAEVSHRRSDNREKETDRHATPNSS